MPPQRPDLVLTADIPHVELDILVSDRLNVETNCRDRCHVLPQLQLVENCRLASGIKPEHKQPHFFRSEDLAHHLGNLSPHFDRL